MKSTGVAAKNLCWHHAVCLTSRILNGLSYTRREFSEQDFQKDGLLNAKLLFLLPQAIPNVPAVPDSLFIT